MGLSIRLSEGRLSEIGIDPLSDQGRQYAKYVQPYPETEAQASEWSPFFLKNFRS